MAPISPPLTGASSIRAPSAAARRSSRRATAGAMLLVSIRMVSRLDRAEHAVRAFEDPLDVGRVRQHRDDACGAPRDLSRRRRPRRPGGDELVHRSLAAAVDDEA